MKQNFFDPAQSNVPESEISHFADQILKLGFSAATEFLNMNQRPGGGKKVDCQKFPVTLFYSLFYNIACSFYSIVAVNDFGTSRPSAELAAATSGWAPVAPPQEELISLVPGALVLLLSAWKDGGCPISSFVAGDGTASCSDHGFEKNKLCRLSTIFKSVRGYYVPDLFKIH